MSSPDEELDHYLQQYLVHVLQDYFSGQPIDIPTLRKAQAQAEPYAQPLRQMSYDAMRATTPIGRLWLRTDEVDDAEMKGRVVARAQAMSPGLIPRQELRKLCHDYARLTRLFDELVEEGYLTRYNDHLYLGPEGNHPYRDKVYAETNAALAGGYAAAKGQ